MPTDIELKIVITISDSELEKRLHITPEKYARFLKDILTHQLKSKSFIPHDDVTVTIEH